MIYLNGQTRRAHEQRTSLSNENEITINHDLGHVPVVEVWIDDEQGGYVMANVDIDHDWTTKNSFVVNIGSNESGKIIYI